MYNTRTVLENQKKFEINKKNDGVQILDLLKFCKDESEIKKVQNCIEGDFTFLYVKPVLSNDQQFEIHVARDVYGKRSCLFGISENEIIITSVFMNVSNSNIESLEKDENQVTEKIEEEKFVIEFSKKKNKFIKKWPEAKKDVLDKKELVEKKYLQSYLEVKNKKMIDQPPNVIFSINVSSKFDDESQKNLLDIEKNDDDKILNSIFKFQLNMNFSIKTLNTKFNEQTSRKISKFDECLLRENQKKIGKVDIENTPFLKNNGDFDHENDESTFFTDYKLNYHEKIIESVDYCLEESVKMLMNLPNFGEFDENISKNETGSKIAVLFSGGLDSTLIAYYLCKNLQTH